ncbi:hypothetical protein SDC9_175241 [bioreactor metagenome]|uniref:Uncharacterized protein n=1 Tax=bioreactor metagenome TaxID=1076179 RepID=A0A645GLP5_9ZZZZ
MLYNKEKQQHDHSPYDGKVGQIVFRYAQPCRRVQRVKVLVHHNRDVQHDHDSQHAQCALVSDYLGKQTPIAKGHAKYAFPFGLCPAYPTLTRFRCIAQRDQALDQHAQRVEAVQRAHNRHKRKTADQSS